MSKKKGPGRQKIHLHNVPGGGEGESRLQGVKKLEPKHEMSLEEGEGKAASKAKKLEL